MRHNWSLNFICILDEGSFLSREHNLLCLFLDLLCLLLAINDKLRLASLDHLSRCLVVDIALPRRKVLLHGRLWNMRTLLAHAYLLPRSSLDRVHIFILLIYLPLRYFFWNGSMCLLGLLKANLRILGDKITDRHFQRGPTLSFSIALINFLVGDIYYQHLLLIAFLEFVRCWLLYGLFL